MINKYHNTSDFALLEVISAEEILKLALENLEHKRGSYYELIKEYILNYKDTDEKNREKIKEIILFIESYAKNYGYKEANKALSRCLNKLVIGKHKNIYVKLYFVCIKHSASFVINQIKNTNQKTL